MKQAAEEQKVTEWRPPECGKLFGEVVEINGRLWLKVKCSRCSKLAGNDRYHYHRVVEGAQMM